MTQSAACRPVLVSEATSREAVFEMVPTNLGWGSLGAMLDEIKPRGLGILLPLISQRHWYAYTEARSRNIVVALAQPTNVSALTGLTTIVPVEAVVATESTALAFLSDLRSVGLGDAVVAWFIVNTEGERYSTEEFPGKVFYDNAV